MQYNKKASNSCIFASLNYSASVTQQTLSPNLQIKLVVGPGRRGGQPIAS